MQFAPGGITLDMILGGTLQSGEIPNARLEADLTSLADALTAGGIVPNANLTPNLPDLANALTVGGIVPNSNLESKWFSSSNAGPITILPTITYIAGVNITDLVVDDIVIVYGMCEGVKGAISGDVNLEIIRTAGAGALAWLYDASSVVNTWSNVVALSGASMTIVGIAYCTGAGTVTCWLQGWSVGSNFGLATGEGQIYCLVVRGG